MSRTNIVRRPDRAEGGVTEAEAALLRDHAELWIKRIMRTEPADRTKLVAAIKRLYAAAGLKEPRVVVVQSPIVMAFAGGAASWIWHCRKAAPVDAYKNVEDIREEAGAATDAACDATSATGVYSAVFAACSTDIADATTYIAVSDATMAACGEAKYAIGVHKYTASGAIYRTTFDEARNATFGVIDAATRSACGEIRRRAIDHAYEAAYEAISAATTEATEAAVRKAFYEGYIAHIQAADEAVCADTEVSADAARACRDLAGEGGIGCATKWWKTYQGGNMSGFYDAYITATRDVIGLRLREHRRYAAWEECAIEGGFRWVHDEFCIVSDFPERILMDDRNRPHCDTGPSHRWRDGWALWHVHGVKVSEQIVMRPETLTPAQIDGEENAEVRRVMLDRFGVARYMSESGAEVVAECPADHPLVGLRTARILRRYMHDDEPVVMLDMLNSTPEPDGKTKRYMIRVDPEAYGGMAARDCLAAMASTYRNPDGSLLFERPEDYEPLVET